MLDACNGGIKNTMDLRLVLWKYVYTTSRWSIEFLTRLSNLLGGELVEQDFTSMTFSALSDHQYNEDELVKLNADVCCIMNDIIDTLRDENEIDDDVYNMCLQLRKHYYFIILCLRSKEQPEKYKVTIKL
jgi:hypothetical protein